MSSVSSAVISALRAYETLTVLERSRASLARILAGGGGLYQGAYEGVSLREFAAGVLSQVNAVLDVGAAGMLCVLAGEGGTPTVLAATGAWADLAGAAPLSSGHPLHAAFARAWRERRSQYEDGATVLWVHTQQQQGVCIAVAPPLPLAPIQRDLLELYGQRIAGAFDNQYLFDRLRGGAAGKAPI